MSISRQSSPLCATSVAAEALEERAPRMGRRERLRLRSFFGGVAGRVGHEPGNARREQQAADERCEVGVVDELAVQRGRLDEARQQLAKAEQCRPLHINYRDMLAIYDILVFILISAWSPALNFP